MPKPMKSPGSLAVDALRKKMERAAESEEKRQHRLSNMVERNRKAKLSESPNTKCKRLEKQRLQKAKKRAEQKQSKGLLAAEDSNAAGQVVNDLPTTSKFPNEEKLCDYEKIRQRNIAEREKLFQELKISQMKAEVSRVERSQKK